MIPKVHLADPGVEPSDEELEALSKAALAEAVNRHRAAEARFQSRMNAALDEALRGTEEDRLVAGHETENRPVLAVIAGPNGSGKTTLTENALRHEWLDGCVYINPDRIAQDLFGDWNSPDAVLKAARHAEGLRRDCLENRRPFAFETVFSTVDKLNFLREARSLGFFIRLFFVGTDGPEINASRVMRRMKEGGHAVPIDKILSRYERSITNLYAALRVVDRGYVYDNSVDFETQRLLFRTVEGCVEKTYGTGHEWAERVRCALPSCYPEEIPGPN